MADTSQKQPYEQMSECLLGFRAGTMKLGDLVERLPELVKELGDDVDPGWKANFVSQWWTLEQVHGQAIDLGESTRMPPDTRRTVDDAVSSLDQLVREALT
jgi:hypothetical protein